MNKPPEKVRALVAVGITGTAVVVATDSPLLKFECEEISGHCDDLGLGRWDESGLFLWEGIASFYARGPNYESDTEYAGAARAVTPEELADLLAMTPPRTCVLCGKPATTTYPDDDGVDSCGSAACELRMQAGQDHHDECGSR